MRAFMIAVMLFLVAPLGSGCVTSQTVGDGLYTAAGCSITTSLSCATQSIAGCIAPGIKAPGSGWKAYANCLWDRAKECQRSGLARCALAGTVEAFGFPGLVSTGPVSGTTVMMSSTVPDPTKTAKCDFGVVRTCINDARIETKKEAVMTVAYCYRHVCGKAKR